MLPRVYQTEVFQLAKDRNTILRMDTGTGKTMVAIMLIRHITSLPIQISTSNPEIPKLVVFIVPTVSLVHQQSEVIKSQTNLRVKAFSGDMGVDFWKREEWLIELNQADAVVCTAQIWLNVLSKAYWSIDRISLLIFDECHHALKNHPSSQIMKDHYHRVKNDSPSLPLPRILGMTASPIWNPKNPKKAIADLENNLHSRIIEVVSNLESIFQFSNKPKEKLIEFEPNPEISFITEFEILLEEVTKDTFQVSRKSWININEVKLKLGTFASNIYIIKIVEEMLTGATTFGTAVTDPTPLSELLIRLKSLLSKQSQSLPSFSTPLNLQLTTTPEHVDLFSPQLITLIKVLMDYKTLEVENFHGIIFVQRRSFAGIINEILIRIKELKNWIKSNFLVGHGSRGGGEDDLGDYGLKIKEQAQTVAKFRTGELNLIVATQVAEEGLDFRACNVVIRFDPLQTITGYIQSRGRARAPNSEFIVLAAKGSNESNTYKAYLAQEPELKKLYQSRPIDMEMDEPELDNLSTYTVNSTGAILTHSASIPLLSEFCSLLPIDLYTNSINSKPIFEVNPTSTGLFIAKVILPMIASLPGKREFHGQPLSTKKAAKQSAAFNVCKELHWNNALNDYLMPVREPRGKGAKDADGNILDPTPTLKSVLVQAKNYFGNFRLKDSKIYLSVLEFQDGLELFTIGLISGASLKDFEIGEYFELNPSRSITFKTKTVVELNDWYNLEEREYKLNQLEELNRISTQVILNRKISTELFFALWTPLLSNGSVDWNLIESAFLPIPSNYESILIKGESTIVFPCKRGNHHIFKYVETRQDVNSLSSSSAIEGSTNELMNSNRRKIIKKYPIYYIYVKVAFEYMGLNEFIPEPILTLSPVSIHPRNHLLPFPSAPAVEPTIDSEEGTTTSTTSNKFYPTSMCRLTNLPDSFFEFFSKTPSILRIIHDVVSTKAAIKQFNFPAIDLKRLIIALTPPSALVGYDYQTLETVGDSALKLATTIHIYLEKPGLDEGQLTNLRQNTVDNKYLNKKCISTGYSSFILHDHFKTIKWLPPTSNEDVTLSTDGKMITRRIGRRALQDSMESTLGAAFLTGGISLVLITGTQLGLCFGGIEPWGERESAKVLMEGDGSKFNTAPSMKGIEEKLGYKFKNGRLLLQAITHRSYLAAETHCYEREEHLGDAVIDYWATTRLLARFPNATPRSITYHRAMLVSNPSLSLLSTKILKLEKNVLHSSSLLHQAMQEASIQAESYNYSDMLSDLTWLWDPPKVLGDVFESIIGSIFVDSGFNLDLILEVLDRMYKDVLPFLVEGETRDPFSRLVIFAQSIHCRQLKVKVTRHSTLPSYTAVTTFHSSPIPGSSITSPSKNISKQLSSRTTLEYFEIEEGKRLLRDGCNCVEELRKEREGEKEKEKELEAELEREKEREERVKREEEVEKEEENEDEEEDREVEDDDEPAAQRVRVY